MVAIRVSISGFLTSAAALSGSDTSGRANAPDHFARLPRPGKKAPAALANVASRSYLGVMRAVGLKTLKNRLAEYIRLAAAGETVLVTDRERVVAELRPPSPGRAERLDDALLADLIRRGLLSPALMPGSEPPAGTPVAGLEKLLAELAEDRAER